MFQQVLQTLQTGVESQQSVPCFLSPCIPMLVWKGLSMSWLAPLGTWVQSVDAAVTATGAPMVLAGSSVCIVCPLAPTTALSSSGISGLWGDSVVPVEARWGMYSTFYVMKLSRPRSACIIRGVISPFAMYSMHALSEASSHLLPYIVCVHYQRRHLTFCHV